jgi:hypothetical protein
MIAAPFTVAADVLPAGTTQAFFQFSFATITGTDPRIDNVAITGTVVPVPEPTTVVLLGAALAGAALIGRRRSA